MRAAMLPPFSPAESAPAPAAIAVEGLDTREAAAFIGVSLSAFKELDASDQLGPEAIRIGTGRIVRWSRRELAAWLLAGAPMRRLWKAMRPTALKQAGA